jgi:hypothetical protein
MSLAVGAVSALKIAAFIHHFCSLLVFGALAKIPGPRSFAWTGVIPTVFILNLANMKLDVWAMSTVLPLHPIIGILSRYGRA